MMGPTVVITSGTQLQVPGYQLFPPLTKTKKAAPVVSEVLGINKGTTLGIISLRE
jgi:hypothetical protein